MAATPIIDPEFGHRLHRLERKHTRLRARGSRVHVGPDGLMVEYPRRHTARFPLKSLVMLLLLAVGFKLWMFAALGGDDYNARVERLAQGNTAEQVAAWLLQPDVFTESAAGWVTDALAALRG